MVISKIMLTFAAKFWCFVESRRSVQFCFYLEKMRNTENDDEKRHNKIIRLFSISLIL